MAKAKDPIAVACDEAIQLANDAIDDLKKARRSKEDFVHRYGVITDTLMKAWDKVMAHSPYRRSAEPEEPVKPRAIEFKPDLLEHVQ